MKNDDTNHNQANLEPDLDLAQKLNLETGTLSWQELQTYFARGIVIVVDKERDLIETAKMLHDDNKTIIEGMIDNGDIIRANDDHARDWLAREPLFWSVVIAPWVLVQEKST